MATSIRRRSCRSTVATVASSTSARCEVLFELDFIRHAAGLCVRGYSVELDPTNTAEAFRRVQEAELEGIEVITGDASTTDTYASVLPADLVLVCGVFGNIPNDDIHRTIQFLPQFCAR